MAGKRRPAAASSLKACYICGEVVADRAAHMLSAHPGIRVIYSKVHPLGRGGRDPVIVGDGDDRPVDMNMLQRSRLAARAQDKAARNVAPPVNDDPPDADAQAQVDSERPKPGGSPRVHQPRPIVRAGVSASVARTEIEGLLTVEFLADQLINLSRALSEADGAGDAGVFSMTQATMISTLIHSSTVDMVVSRFGGNVNRFKLTLAVGIVLVSKGRVHAVAIAENVQRRRYVRQAAELDELASADAEAGDEYTGEDFTAPPPAPEPVVTLTPMQELARRQRGATVIGAQGG